MTTLGSDPSTSHTCHPRVQGSHNPSARTRVTSRVGTVHCTTVPDRNELESRLKSTPEDATGNQDLLLSVRTEIREVRAGLEALRENSQDPHL